MPTDLERIANAAQKFARTYDMAMSGYTWPDAIDPALEVLEDAIMAYRQHEPRQQQPDGTSYP